jgi:putative ABC transport system substrate-binding protein
MRRREFVMFAVAAAVVAPLAVWAQPVTRHRIAFLSGGSNSGAPFEAFREGMRHLGYGDQELAIESRGAEGHNEHLAELAAELVQLAPEVIVTGSSAAAVAAKRATSSIPIVTVFTADPLGSGLASSLARPGGNVTGLSNIMEDTAGKELELLKTAAPQATHIAVLTNPGNPSHAKELRGAQEAARVLGVELHLIEVRAPSEIDNAFSTMTSVGTNALVVLGDPLFVGAAARQIADLAAKHNLPAIYGLREHVADGGLMSYGPDLRDSFRRGAAYVDKILKGAKPADLPFEQPTKLELVINLKAAHALGLTVPQSLLARADEVIE